MSTIRVYELAKEVGLESKDVLKLLAEQGEFVRSASSTLAPASARRVRETLAQAQPGQTREPPRMRGVAVERLRVHELAAELAIEPSDLLALVAQEGHPAASILTPLEPEIVRKIRSSHRESADTNYLAQQPRGSLPPAASAEARSAVPAAALRDEAVSPPIRSGWHAGAVSRPKDALLASLISALRMQHPIASAHLDSLQRLGSQFVHVARCRGKRMESVWFTRVRFSAAIETGFGFTREVLFTYSPFRDLQSRLVSEIREELKGRAALATPDIVFVSAPDPRLRTKLADWSTHDLLLIPLDAPIEDSPLAFIGLLQEFLYRRDLFYETTPVRGANFFGRRKLLRALRDDVNNRSVAGLYGLRKAGKTSVLTELSETVGTNIVPILMDLEAFPSPPDDPTPYILSDLRLRLRDALEQRGVRPNEIVELPDQPSITQWKTATQAVLKHLHTNNISVLLMLDEVEYLTSDNLREGNLPQISQLLGSFRSLVQETQNFTFILSGLTSAITESGRLYGRPNPLFAWAKSYFLGPFDKADADELATGVGGRMGITFDEGGLQALHDGSGGHAFLYRSLASAAVQSLPKDLFGRGITATEVQKSYPRWKMDVAGNVTEMVDHVTRYYPTEAILLEILAEEPESFLEIAATEPSALKHLLDLGLVYEVDHHYALNSLLELA